MILKLWAAGIGMVLLLGCAHRAKHFNVPSAVEMQASQARLSSAVTESGVTAAKARSSLAKVQRSMAVESVQIAAIGPKLTELFRIAPVELQPIIAGVQADVERLKDAHVITAGQMEDTRHQQAILENLLTEAGAAREDHATDQANYVARAHELAERANIAEQAWAKNSREILKLRTQSWLFKIGAGLGVLAVGGLAFLFFTGRIANALR